MALQISGYISIYIHILELLSVIFEKLEVLVEIGWIYKQLLLKRV